MVKSSNVKSENYATYMVSFVGPRIWETIVVVRQNTISLEVFKGKKMDSRNCLCRTCKKYVKGLGFCNIAGVIAGSLPFFCNIAGVIAGSLPFFEIMILRIIIRASCMKLS